MWIDVHVHPVLVKELTDNRPQLVRAVDEIFDLRTSPQPISNMLSEMDVCGIERSIPLPINCEKSHDCKIPSNQEIAEIARLHPSRFVGFASVDPNAGQQAMRELRQAHDQLGLRGLKLNPAPQDLDPTGPLALQLYEEAERLGIPILIHTGITFCNRFSISRNQPLRLGDIARKHPRLNLLGSHGLALGLGCCGCCD